MLNKMNSPNPYHAHSLQFAGRMKTVREKQVTHGAESGRFLFENSGGPNDDAPPFIIPALTTGAGGGVLVFHLLPAATAAPYAAGLAVTAGVAIPAGMSGTAYLADRKVTYEEKQVPMTQDEEWAVMTPLERANSQVDQALTKWQELRQRHVTKIQQFEAVLAQINQDLAQMTQELDEPNRRYQEMKDKPVEQRIQAFSGTHESWTAFENRVKQLNMRLDAKTKTQQEQQQLLVMANQVYETLNVAVMEREQKLYETKESLNMMAQRNSVLEMHRDLKTVQGQPTQAVEQASLKVTVQEPHQDPQMMLALEKQKLEIEALMASVKTAMDVQSVLATTETGSGQ